MTDTATPNAEMIRWWAQLEGPHYVTEAERYDNMLEAFSDAMFEAAELQPGQRVLDIGCGRWPGPARASTRPGGPAAGPPPGWRRTDGLAAVTG